MSKSAHDESTFHEKRRPKNPIKFNITLNEEQKLAKEKILRSTITVLAGRAGSGKTLLACQIALDGLFRKEYEKIIITRPTVSKEDIGFLPGNLKEKLDPWVQPIYQNMYQLYDREKVNKHLENSDIEIVPISLMRGRTFLDSCVIVDEAQNVTMEQRQMIVTRVGLRSKMIICGDAAQIDLKTRRESGFSFLYDAAQSIQHLEAILLETNHRNPIVDELIEYYSRYG